MGDKIQSNRNIAVDLYNPRAIQVYAKQGDRMSRFITVSIYDNGTFVFLDKNKVSAVVKYIKPSGDFGIDSCEIDDYGRVIISLTDGFTSNAGRINAEITLIQVSDLDGEDEMSYVLTTMQFCVNVLSSTFKPEDVYDTTSFNAMYDLMSKFLSDYSDIMQAASGLITLVKSVNGVSADDDKNVQIGYEDIGLIKTSNIDNLVVTLEKIADNAISTAKVLNGAITADKLDASSVVEGKIADNAVLTSNIKDLNVTSDKIAIGAVVTDRIADLSVTDDKLAESSVIEEKIADGAVTNEKVEAGTLTGDRMADKTIPRSKIVDSLLSSSDKEGIDKVRVQSRDMNIGGHKITNIGAPSSSTDATNKQYVDESRKIFKSVSVPKSAFSQNTTYADFGYRASVTLAGCLSTMIPDVVFPVQDDVQFAPVAESYNGGIYIYADDIPANGITIPTIILWRGDSV